MTQIRLDDDVVLDAVERGSGPPLVLVHGSGSDLRTWTAQLETLGHHHEVIAYSRRFHWPDDTVPEGDEYAMETHVDDLEAILRHVGDTTGDGPDAAHLAGHSYGGFVSLLAALRWPELVRSLILVEPPVITLFVSDPPRPLELLRLLVTRPRAAVELVRFGIDGLGPATAAAKRGDMETAGERFGRAVLGDEAYDALSEERLEQARANTFRSEFLGPGFPDVEPAEVRRLDVPTLLVVGSESPGIFREVASRLDELLPESRMVEIEGASHLVHEDRPAEFEARVLEFLEGR